MNKQPSLIGGACIIAGVCVGAGMLALPLAGAGAWSLWATAAIVLTMLMMTLSGWLLLEAYKHYDLRASFNTVTRDVLGAPVNVINNLAVYFVGGILLYAYITRMGLMLHDISGGSLSPAIASILACLVGGAFVWHSTRAVDRVSVLLIVFMVATFLFSIYGLVGGVHLDILLNRLPHPAGSDDGYARYVLAFLPVCLTSFGYHHSVTSMRAYYSEERQAARAILYGTLLAMGIYLLWTLSIFGNLPRGELGPIAAADSVEQLTAKLGVILHSSQLGNIISAFALGAVVSSFIGVGLGVFDYLADTFHFADNRLGRSQTWLATFLPPLVCSLLWPMGFTMAIGYAGAVATIWTCMVPAALVWKTRARHGTTGYTVPGGAALLAVVFLYGILVALFHFLNMLHKLPVYQG
nr:aromatic amino acid transport family protein [uncultured Cardiobacterium sp.]